METENLEVLLAQALKKKAAQTDRPRKVSESESAESDSAERGRSIPAAVRREVWQRDEGRCAFVSADGHRCGSQRQVEFHHVVAFGKGGRHEVGNVELRCRAHNTLHAEQDYGRRFMESKRNPPRVSEARSVYRPRTSSVRTAQVWDIRILGKGAVEVAPVRSRRAYGPVGRGKSTHDNKSSVVFTDMGSTHGFTSSTMRSIGPGRCGRSFRGRGCGSGRCGRRGLYRRGAQGCGRSLGRSSLGRSGRRLLRGR